MKIKRTISVKTESGGTQNIEQEFELTANELREAFWEQQEEYDRADMMYYLEDNREDLLEQYKRSFVDGLSEYLGGMGAELRRQIDKYDVPWDSARDEAFNVVVRQITATLDEAEYKIE